GVVAQLPVMEIEGTDIEAHAIDAELEPAPAYLEDCVLNLGIVEVEIRLLPQKIVQVVLASPRLPLPRRSTEYGKPVVGRRSVGPRIGPYVPVGFRCVSRLPTFEEPRMLIRGVAQHLIHDHLNFAFVRFLDET